MGCVMTAVELRASGCRGERRRKRKCLEQRQQSSPSPTAARLSKSVLRGQQQQPHSLELDRRAPAARISQQCLAATAAVLRLRNQPEPSHRRHDRAGAHDAVCAPANSHHQRQQQSAHAPPRPQHDVTRARRRNHERSAELQRRRCVEAQRVRGNSVSDERWSFDNHDALCVL